MGYRSFMHALGLLLLATTVTVAANDHAALTVAAKDHAALTVAANDHVALEQEVSHHYADNNGVKI
ncbi:MAG: hypothetical protein VX140_06340, partial [Pseudomonadota bacterium]|nr:hypothetical protein [Pseudomonadota bacterium]